MGRFVDGASIVGNRVIVEDNAFVYVGAMVSGFSEITGNAVLADGADVAAGEVIGGTLSRPALCILGGRFAACISAPGVISIGCMRGTVSFWLDVASVESSWVHDILREHPEDYDAELDWYLGALAMLVPQALAWAEQQPEAYVQAATDPSLGVLCSISRRPFYHQQGKEL